MENLKNKIEALLFASSKKLSVDELPALTREADFNAIREAVAEFGKDLEAKDSSLVLVEEAGTYRLTVKSEFTPYVKKIVKQTELPKSLTETLAVVAYKSPAKQSEIIKIRHNKGYKHLDELEKSGFIMRVKKGRSKEITLTQKFYDYFELSPDQLKKKFGSLDAIEKNLEQAAAKSAAEPKVEVVKEELGRLDVYESEKQTTPGLSDAIEVIGEEKVEETTEKIIENSPTLSEAVSDEQKLSEEIEISAKGKPKKSGNRMFPNGLPPEVEKKVDERVREMVEGEEDDSEMS